MKTDLKALIALTYNECDANGESILNEVIVTLSAEEQTDAIAAIIKTAQNDEGACTVCVLAQVRNMLKGL